MPRAHHIGALLLYATLLGGNAMAQSSAPFSQPAPTPAVKPGPPPPPGSTPVRRSIPLAGLYIAGDGFSLEQAIGDGLRETAGKGPFSVLVLGAEISKLGIHGATSEVSAVILKATRGGGTLYVCERDVKRQGFAAGEFLPGVQVVRGFTKAEAQSAASGSQSGGVATPTMLRMRQICSD